MGTKPDLYTKVHKGLRKALFELSCCAGKTDGLSDEDIISLAKLFNEVTKYLDEHSKNEELYQLPILEKKIPGSTNRNYLEHQLIEKQLEALKRNFNNLVSSSVKDRKLKTEVFYLLLNDFISFYLQHMLTEELETAKLFNEHCSEEELNSVIKNILSNTSPQDMLMMLRYIIPAINRIERVELVQRIKNHASQQALNAVLVLAHSILAAEEYDYLIENLKSERTTKQVWEAVA